MITVVAVGVEQERPIAAAHHAGAKLDEADGVVAQVVARPGQPEHVWSVEQGGCNVSVSRILKPTVEQAEAEDQSVPLRFWQGGRFASWIAPGD